ncbi:MAG: D-glycerate dehydrogenase [bacterium]|nr:D-glycerate dehydrogenase [bacterium]MDE0289966.1 D-glycerate dehydrogenase [bacterium]
MERLRPVSDVWMWPENRAIPRGELLDRVRDAQGLYCMLTDGIDAELLAAAPRLAAVSQMAVGVDNVDLSACTERGIPVGHTPDVLTETTADTAFGLLIAAARRFREGMEDVLEGRWGEWDPAALLGRDLHGSTLGIVGLGRIGRAVARRAAGFRMRVLYNKRSRDHPAEERLGVEFRSFGALLAESDHVVVLTSLNSGTHGLIDRAALAMMKPTATLVNASRGQVVDTDALVEALSCGWIAAAGLDVTDPEPMPSSHRLVSLPNCLVVPHIGSATVRTRTLMAERAAENLVAALRGKQMPYCANPEVYG